MIYEQLHPETYPVELLGERPTAEQKLEDLLFVARFLQKPVKYKSSEDKHYIKVSPNHTNEHLLPLFEQRLANNNIACPRELTEGSAISLSETAG